MCGGDQFFSNVSLFLNWIYFLLSFFITKDNIDATIPFARDFQHCCISGMIIHVFINVDDVVCCIILVSTFLAVNVA